MRFETGLERERALAAVDVAHVSYAVSYAEIHEAAIIWRIVVFADAKCVSPPGAARLGSVVSEIRLAGYDNPVFAGSAGQPN
ncbi:MAG: hypothetical protein ACLTQI_06745 [Slackia sp.]